MTLGSRRLNEEKTIAAVIAVLLAVTCNADARLVPTIPVTPENETEHQITVRVENTKILHPHQDMLTFKITCPQSKPGQDFKGIQVRLFRDNHVIAVFFPPVVETDGMLSGEFTVSADQAPLTHATVSYGKKYYPRPDDNPDKLYSVDLKAYLEKNTEDPNKALEAIGDPGSPQPQR